MIITSISYDIMYSIIINLLLSIVLIRFNYINIYYYEYYVLPCSCHPQAEGHSLAQSTSCRMAIEVREAQRGHRSKGGAAPVSDAEPTPQCSNHRIRSRCRCGMEVVVFFSFWWKLQLLTCVCFDFLLRSTIVFFISM